MERIQINESWYLKSEQLSGGEVPFEAGFKQGSQSMLNSVEKMLRDKIEITKGLQDTEDYNKQAWYFSKTHLLEELLTELKTIKPL